MSVDANVRRTNIPDRRRYLCVEMARAISAFAKFHTARSIRSVARAAPQNAHRRHEMVRHLRRAHLWMKLQRHPHMRLVPRAPAKPRSPQRRCAAAPATMAHSCTHRRRTRSTHLCTSTQAAVAGHRRAQRRSHRPPSAPPPTPPRRTYQPRPRHPRPRQLAHHRRRIPYLATLRAVSHTRLLMPPDGFWCQFVRLYAKIGGMRPVSSEPCDAAQPPPPEVTRRQRHRRAYPLTTPHRVGKAGGGTGKGR